MLQKWALAVCLGTSETEAMHIIDEAIDLGINFFDTADLYDYGLNEEFVGKALKGRETKLYLQRRLEIVGQKKKMAGLGILLKLT